MIDIILLMVIIVAVVLYLYSSSSDKSQKPKKSTKSKKPQCKNNKIYEYDNGRFEEECVPYWEDDTTGVYYPNFLNIKFNNGYRRVMSAFLNIVPDKRQIFNLPNIPVKYSTPAPSDIRQLVNDFIRAVNTELIRVPNVRNKNTGWDEPIKDPTVESGWDKFQKSLGLMPSMFNETDPNGSVKLIGVKNVQKYETDDEVRYVVEMVIQMEGAEDQCVVKVSMIQDLRPLVDENTLFYNNTVNLKVIIENIDIVGYLSLKGEPSNRDYDPNYNDNYYDYNEMEKNNMTDPKYIERVLMSKYYDRAAEIEGRTAMLDEEGRDFQTTLPDMTKLQSIKNTRTIFDDFNTPRIFK